MATLGSLLGPGSLLALALRVVKPRLVLVKSRRLCDCAAPCTAPEHEESVESGAPEQGGGKATGSQECPRNPGTANSLVRGSVTDITALQRKGYLCDAISIRYDTACARTR